MANSTASKKQSDTFDITRLDQFIADGRCDGNPLLPALQRLSDEYKKLERKHAKLAKEHSFFQTQLVDMARSLDLASRIDQMTGLANRRDIMEKIEQEFSRAHRHSRTFTIILADMDNFKRINETHGFNAGDDVLVEIARVLRGCVRSEDICARWSGEEFLILLPETPVEGALSVANKIQESIEMTLFKANKQGIRTTISLGVCAYNADQSVYDCIARADQALRIAKSTGKNKAVVAP